MKKDFKLFGLERNVFASGMVSLFMDFSSEMIYPLIPLFLSNVIGVNKSVIGLIEGIAESTASILKVFSGWFSDRMGKRKRFMLIGYSISVLSRPLVALSSSWQQVLGYRFVDRFGKGIRGAPRDAIIAESADKELMGRAFGFQRAMDTVGAIIGPAAAFLLLAAFANDYRKVFWLSIIPGIIAVLCIIFFIRDVKPADRQAVKPRFTLKVFDWRFKFFVLIVAVFAFGNSSDVFLILRAQQAGIPVGIIPLVYLTFNLVYSLSSVPAGMAADKFGKKRIILLGFLVFAAVYFGFAVAESTSGIWILFLFYGLYMGLTEGVQKAFLTTIIPPDFKATAYGIYNMVVGLAMFPASLIGGLLWDRVSPAATFYFGALTAGLSAVMFGIFIIAIRRDGTKQQNAR